MRNRSEYHPFAKFLHWTVVVLVSIQFLSSSIMPSVRGNASPDYLVNIHMSFGIIVLPIAILLLFMRFFRPVAKLETPMPTLQEKAAVAMHYMLYILLILLPFSGWAFASSRGWTVSVFNSFDLPTFFEKGSSLGHSIGAMHSFFGTIIGFLILGHIAAALYHHFVLKDSVLRRMIPKHK